jgi:hypothetical protein
LSPNAFHTETEEDTEDTPPLFVGYNRDQSIVVTYSYYGFVDLQLADAAYRLTEKSLARGIVEVAKLAHQRAMAALRELQLSLGTSRHVLDRRRLPTHDDIDALQQRIDEDPDL